jgi:phosphatidylglycerophosphate synthase
MAAHISRNVIKNTYYSNWGDIFGYPLAYALLPYVTKIKFLTPNVITLLAFSSFTIGSVSLFLNYPYHLIVAGILIPLGFVGDDLDGQVARARQLSSNIGDFLDKVLDVLKIFIITSSLGLAVYLQTNDVLYIFLGFIACFFFLFRYYIKLETMFSAMSRDNLYLEKSTTKRNELIQQIETMYETNQHSLIGRVKNMFHMNRTVLFVDEAELAIFTSIGALFNRLDLALWVIALAQVIIAFYRFYERGYQLNINSEDLFKPLRK